MSCVHVPAIEEVDACENDAGVEILHVIADNDLVFPLPAVTADSHTIPTDLSLVDSAVAGFEKWTFLEESCEHKEDANDNGKYDSLFEMKFPKDDEDKRYLFKKMNSRCCRWSIIYTDENGMQKLQTGLKFKDNFTTGKGGTNNDNNEYTVQFSKTGDKAYTYTGIIPVKV
jgi:hypothetical protein